MKPLAELMLGVSLGLYFLGLQYSLRWAESILPTQNPITYLFFGILLFILAIVLWKTALDVDKQKEGS